MGSRRRPRWRAAGAPGPGKEGARCECSHRAFLPIWFETVVGWQGTPDVCAHIGNPLPWMSRLRRPSGLPPAQTSGMPRPVADGLPPRPLTSGSRRHHAGRPRGRGGEGVTPARLHSLALCRSRPPSETAPRVYTRDGLSGGGRGVDALPTGETCRRREQMPETSHRVYTREGLSGIRGASLGHPAQDRVPRVHTGRDFRQGEGPGLQPTGETRRRGQTMSGATSCVYTRDEVSAGARSGTQHP